jgi:hypothetical protein
VGHPAIVDQELQDAPVHGVDNWHGSSLNAVYAFINSDGTSIFQMKN